MKSILLSFLCPVLVLAVVCHGHRAEPGKATTGTLTGVVRFTGVVPPPKKVPLTDGSILEHHDLIVDAKSKGLKFVVAVLEDAPAQPPLEKAEPVVMDQRDMVFLPRVLAMQHGRPVRFENNDLCNHSVMTASLVPADQFNRVAATGQPIQHTFTAGKHPVLVGCSLHGWMRAYLYVLPHPWFAVSDAHGRFEIKNVPPGKYSLWLRHPDTGLNERRTVEMDMGKKTEVTVEWQKVGG